MMSINIEGMDLKIIKQLIPKKITPQLVSIETHDPDENKLRDCDEINDFLILNNYSILYDV